MSHSSCARMGKHPPENNRMVPLNDAVAPQNDKFIRQGDRCSRFGWQITLSTSYEPQEKPRRPWTSTRRDRGRSSAPGTPSPRQRFPYRPLEPSDTPLSDLVAVPGRTGCLLGHRRPGGLTRPSRGSWSESEPSVYEPGSAPRRRNSHSSLPPSPSYRSRRPGECW